MNVAIVKLSSLGDVVHALPVAAALRARPSRTAHLTWVVERREAALLAGNPGPRRGGRRSTRASWRRLSGTLAHAVRAVRALLAPVSPSRASTWPSTFRGMMKSGLLTAATGAAAPHRVHGSRAAASR